MSCKGRHSSSRHSGFGWGSIYNTPHASLPQGEVHSSVDEISSLLGCEALMSHTGLGTACCPQQYYPFKE
jgi:hypothetical protein